MGERDRPHSRLQRHQPLSGHQHEKKKAVGENGWGHGKRGEESPATACACTSPFLPVPLYSPPPHTCILRGTSVPCSFSSTRPPNCRNRRGLPQFYYNRSQKCVVSASAFSLQNKSAEHSGVGTRTHEQRRADAPVQTAPVVSAALFTGIWIGL